MNSEKFKNGSAEMSGAGYFVKCVRGLNIDKMIETAKQISKKTGRNATLILIDMVYCGMRFKAGYNDYREFEFYLINNRKRATYLTRCLNNSIVKKYNDKDNFALFDDKAAFFKEYSRYIGRDWIDLRECEFKEFEEFTKKFNEIVVKPFDGQCGEGVEKIKIEADTDIPSLYKTLMKNDQLLVEEYIHQHPEMARLNPSAVNSLRMFTFYRNGESYLLQTILKIGNKGSVDNFYNGGMYTFADENGVVNIPAIDRDDNVYSVHPITGTEIIGFKIPMIEEAENLVLEAAKEHPEEGYVGWDVAISVQGPLIIEGNVYPGIFQPRAGFSKNGEGVLPLYRKYMEI